MQLPADKDTTISQVLSRLSSDLGSDAFVLMDHWEQDLMAVGIASRTDTGRLVYISTFACNPGRYDVELELPPSLGGKFPYTNAGEFSSLEYEALVEIVRRHLVASTDR